MCKIILLFFIILNLGLKAQTITDIDGNVYNTITIGTQVWMKENLKVLHYSNGDTISEVRDSIDWINQISGAWCYFDNDPYNGIIYGCLYNWYSVNDDRGLAPVGWHVPSDDEWKTLEMYLGMTQSESDKSDWRGTGQGAMLKETDTIHWKWPTGNVATNSSGFTALPGGWRLYFMPPAGYTSFNNITATGEWWSSTESDATSSWLRNLCAYHADINRSSFGKTHGCSVRCIKDSPEGIRDINDDAVIKIYPNPASEYIEINLERYQTVLKCRTSEIEIYNTFGESVISDVQHLGDVGHLKQIDISGLAVGLYFIQIDDNIFRFIKI